MSNDLETKLRAALIPNDAAWPHRDAIKFTWDEVLQAAALGAAQAYEDAADDVERFLTGPEGKTVHPGIVTRQLRARAASTGSKP